MPSFPDAPAFDPKKDHTEILGSLTCRWGQGPYLYDATGKAVARNPDYKPSIAMVRADSLPNMTADQMLSRLELSFDAVRPLTSIDTKRLLGEYQRLTGRPGKEMSRAQLITAVRTIYRRVCKTVTGEFPTRLASDREDYEDEVAVAEGPSGLEIGVPEPGPTPEPAEDVLGMTLDRSPAI